MNNEAITHDFADIIGTVIRQERKLQGLTQTELAEFSGVGLNFISQLERGKNTVRFDKTLAVLNVLGVQLRIERGKQIIVVAPELSK